MSPAVLGTHRYHVPVAQTMVPPLQLLLGVQGQTAPLSRVVGALGVLLNGFL